MRSPQLPLPHLHSSFRIEWESLRSESVDRKRAATLTRLSAMPHNAYKHCVLTALMGGRLTVRLRTLTPPIGVRIPASQPMHDHFLPTSLPARAGLQSLAVAAYTERIWGTLFDGS